VDKIDDMTAREFFNWIRFYEQKNSGSTDKRESTQEQDNLEVFNFLNAKVKKDA